MENKEIKYFKIIGVLFLFLIFLNIYSLKVYALQATVSASPESKSNIYYGSSWSSNIYVTNNNAECDIQCSAYDDKTGVYLGSTRVLDNGQNDIIPINILVDDSPKDGYQTDIIRAECFDVLKFWPCSSSQTYKFTISTSYYYCGDNSINGGEQCDSSNFGGKTCQNLGYVGGTLSCSSNCNTLITSNCYKCGDGQINPGEQCDSGQNNGKPCTANYGSSCNYCDTSCKTITVNGGFCGDGVKNGPENCNSCYQDTPCPDGQTACSSNGECIDLSTNENCGSIGNRCDTSQKISSTGQNTCSSDNARAIQVQTIASYKCINKACQLQQTQQNSEENCGNNLCQDGHCGCNEGYNPCQPSGKCERNSIVENNEYCKCDFQCKSGICENSACIEGLISNFNSQKTAIKPNDETPISFNVKNPFDYPISANLIVKLGSGVGTSAVISGEDCRGSQCTTSLEIPAKGNKDISLTVSGNSVGIVPLTATLTYPLKGITRTVDRDITVKVTECGKEDCSTSTFLGYLINTKINLGNYELSLLLLTIISAIIILIILSIVFIMHSHFKHRHPKESADKEAIIEKAEEEPKKKIKKRKKKIKRKRKK